MNETLSITEISLELIDGQEHIVFGNNYFTVDKKGLALEIAAIPDSILYHISQNINRNRKLFLEEWAQTINNDRIINGAKQIFIIDKFAESIKDEIVSISSYENNPVFFIFLYPLFAILVEYRVHYGFKTYVERTPEYIRDQHKDYVGYLKGYAKDIVKNPIRAIFKEKISECELIYQTMEELSFYLCGEMFSTLPLNETNTNLYSKCLNDYSEVLIDHINSLLALKPKLAEYLEKQQKGHIKTFEDLPDWLKTSYFSSKDAFNVLTMTQAIAIEQHHLLHSHKYFKICQLCGRPFYANKNNTKYCDFPNDEYDGKTCREIGHKKTTLSKSPLHHTYLNHQKVYRNWINRNKTSHPEILNGPIIKEMEKNYMMWNAAAQKALSLFAEDEIDYEEALEMMKIPDTCEKSPLLDKYLHK